MKIRDVTLEGIVFASALGFATGAFANNPSIWIDDSLGNLGTVDVATGTANLIGNMGTVMTDIAFDPTGKLYGISSSSLYSIDTTTAAATLIGGSFSAWSSYGTLNSLVFDSTGTLWAASRALFKVNVSSGALSYVGAGNSIYSNFQSAGDLAFVGGKLYLSDNTNGNDRLFQINTANVSTSCYVGCPNSSGYITDGSNYYQNVFGLATPDNVHLYGVDGTTILGINTSSGAATVLANYANQGLGAAYGSAFYTEAGATVAAVPEPETYAMMLAGLGLLGFMGRRRKQKETA